MVVPPSDERSAAGRPLWATTFRDHEVHEAMAEMKATKIRITKCYGFVRFVTLRLNRANRGFSTVVGLSQLASFETTWAAWLNGQ
jgi:hypothetical protein